MSEHLERLSREELEAESGSRLPDKEVVSLLDLFVNIDLALDLAAPVDLAVAANANAAAPIDAAVTANLLSLGSDAQALSAQTTGITQHLSADAIADAPQNATIDQSNDVIDGGTTDAAASPAAGAITPDEQVVGVTTEPVGDVTSPVGDTVDGTVGGVTDEGTLTDTIGGVGDTVDGTVGDVTDTVDGVTGDATDIIGGVTGGGLLDDGLLKVNVDVAVDADMAAPIAGAVAANAKVAAPIDASVAANIASVDSSATAVAQQTAIIEQSIDGATAQATAAQDADITQ